MGEIAGVAPVFADLPNEEEAEAVAAVAGAAVREVAPGPSLTFYEANILDRAALETIFTMHAVDVIIHFAGFKAVGESVAKPLEYYWNNIAGTLGSVRSCSRARLQEHRVLVERHGVRRAGVRAHHRKLPEARRHQPLWLDQIDAGADPFRPVHGR